MSATTLWRNLAILYKDGKLSEGLILSGRGASLLDVLCGDGGVTMVVKVEITGTCACRDFASLTESRCA